MTLIYDFEIDRKGETGPTINSGGLWLTNRVVARTFDGALRKCRKLLRKGESIREVKLVAAADDDA